MPWLSAPPLIYPISWAEQARLLPRLAAHHQGMVEFAVNTGARDENVCGLKWEWEVHVPELERSVFVIPPEFFKTNRKHVLILNDRAWAIAESKRGEHKQYVFTWEGPNHERDRVGTINIGRDEKSRKSRATCTAVPEAYLASTQAASPTGTDGVM